MDLYISGENYKSLSYIPRALYKKCADIDELKKPAVYLLFGEKEDSERPVVYIGETEDAYTRLKDHEDKKDYWNEAVVFVSQDDHFNKAHVKYLEGRLYDIATSVDRYTVMNSQKPISASIAIDEQAEMEDFIDNIIVLAYGMGHKVFEPLLKKDSTTNDIIDKEIFFIKNKEVDAKMIRTTEGYVVLKGSNIREKVTTSIPTWAKKKRAQLIAEGTVQNGIFIRDALFLSPSGAASTVMGNSSNGKLVWKTEAGLTLGEILDK